MGQCQKTANRSHEGAQCLSACKAEIARGLGRHSPRRAGLGLQGSAPPHPWSVKLRRWTTCLPSPSALRAALGSASCLLPSVSSRGPTMFQRLPHPCSRVISRMGTATGRASPPGLPGQRGPGRDSADCVRDTWSSQVCMPAPGQPHARPGRARARAGGKDTAHTQVHCSSVALEKKREQPGYPSTEDAESSGGAPRTQAKANRQRHLRQPG